MGARQRLKVSLPDSRAINATVELGGHEVGNVVSGIDLHLRAGQPVVATVELFDLPVDLVAVAEVRLPERTQALLKRLGWTPPEEAP